MTEKVTLAQLRAAFAKAFEGNPSNVGITESWELPRSLPHVCRAWAPGAHWCIAVQANSRIKARRYLLHVLQALPNRVPG